MPPCSAYRYFSFVYKGPLFRSPRWTDDYLSICQNTCSALPSCVGIAVVPDNIACRLYGEGMKSTDEAAAESASGEDEWVYNYNSRSGSGVIAGTSGTSGYECFKKIGWRPGTPMRAPRLPAAHRHP